MLLGISYGKTVVLFAEHVNVRTWFSFTCEGKFSITGELGTAEEDKASPYY